MFFAHNQRNKCHMFTHTYMGNPGLYHMYHGQKRLLLWVAELLSETILGLIPSGWLNLEMIQDGALQFCLLVYNLI